MAVFWVQQWVPLPFVPQLSQMTDGRPPGGRLPFENAPGNYSREGQHQGGDDYSISCMSVCSRKGIGRFSHNDSDLLTMVTQQMFQAKVPNTISDYKTRANNNPTGAVIPLTRRLSVSEQDHMIGCRDRQGAHLI